MLGLAHDVARLSGLRRWGDVFRYRLRAAALPSLRQGTSEQPSMYMLWNYTWCFYMCACIWHVWEGICKRRTLYICMHTQVCMIIYGCVCRHMLMRMGYIYIPILSPTCKVTNVLHFAIHYSKTAWYFVWIITILYQYDWTFSIEARLLKYRWKC